MRRQPSGEALAHRQCAQRRGPGVDQASSALWTWARSRWSYPKLGRSSRMQRSALQAHAGSTPPALCSTRGRSRMACPDQTSPSLRRQWTLSSCSRQTCASTQILGQCPASLRWRTARHRAEIELGGDATPLRTSKLSPIAARLSGINSGPEA